MLLVLIVVLIALSLGWGGWGGRHYYPNSGHVGSWSPLGLLVLILLVLWLTGTLSAGSLR